MVASSLTILQHIPFEPVYIGTGELFEKVYPYGARYPECGKADEVGLRLFEQKRKMFSHQINKMEKEGWIKIIRAKPGGVNLITRVVQ